MLTWLRKTIERTMSAAKIISDGGFVPQRWDTVPPGQVNPEEIPASRAVTAAIGAEPDEVCGWVQIVAYDRLNNEPPEADCRESAAPVILVDDGRRQHEHIILNDPRNTVARCEAELAILDEHYILFKDDRNPDYDEFSVVKIGGADGDSGCITCHYYGMGGVKGYGICRTVRLLAAGYRHHPGYAEAGWGS